MPTFSKLPLSVSTQGRGILLSTSTTNLHVTGSSTSVLDEVWLYAHNTSTNDVKVTIQFGNTSTGDLIESIVKAESGLFLVLPGLILTGTGSAGNTVSGFAATASVVNIFGYVNRIA